MSFNMLLSRNFLLSLAIGSLLFSCSKEPGEGGRGAISGRIWLEEYNPLGDLTASYAAADERVYIQYGTSEIYNDEMRTHHDGRFIFDFLKAGDYTIFAYSECDTCDSGIQVIQSTVTLESAKDEVDIGDLTIAKY